jgi:ATP-dependent Clp protease ATP-binding subunit ClpA
VWFFCGPTGVGKTEAALALARILGGGDAALLQVNCNTLQGSGHDSGPAINVLLGPPPGYVGYVRGQGGVLSKVRDEPESVVLFDEIEKADPGVAKVLLQILDKGRVEDSAGNPLDFRRAFVVFTSNAGCDYDHRSIGFSDDAPNERPTVDVEAVKAELRQRGYGEEFMGRVDRFFQFQSLDAAAMRVVIGRQLDGIRKSAEERGFTFACQPDVIEHLASAWEPRFGVRHLQSILRQRVIEQLGLAEAAGELSGVKSIALDVLRLEGLSDPSAAAGATERQRVADTLHIRIA